ncbi:outer membrane beta-barrel protein [Vibrio cionasavignyae]|uniref:outer membrane beta-barrel protein n=1 Tax=Vibrio cionasavignyae TaxID=2910252 RepID=UPI003D107CCB
MKKVLLGAVISGSVVAHDYSGFRLGVGSTLGASGSEGVGSLGPQTRLEIGYDLNGYLSVNLHTTMIKRWEEERSQDPQHYHYARISASGYRTGAELEAGYTFDIQDGWGVKPYTAFGFMHQSGKLTKSFSDTTNHTPIHRVSHSLEASGLIVAAGVRIMPTHRAAYGDVRINYEPLNGKYKFVQNSPTFTISFGAKF